jgi:peptidoglycan/LPS O-acetylase OafA/YrhL
MDARASTAATPVPATTTGAPLRPHYPCLEGLRTLGVMALFFQHTGYSTGIQQRAGFSWMGHLEWGPGMFFVLSAFLLYQPFAIAAFSDRAPMRWGPFMKARLLRVLPAYWVTITLLILFFRADPDDPFSGGVKVFGWRDAIEVYTLTQVYDPVNFAAGITAAYTLCTELVFYLVVPLFGAWLVRASRGRTLDERLQLQLLALGALSVAAFAWRQVVYAPVRPQGGTFCAANPDSWRCAAVRWFPGYLDYFCLGAAVAAVAVWLMLRDEPPRWAAFVGRVPELWWGLFAATFVLYSRRYGTFGLETVAIGEYQIRYYLVGLMCLLLLLPGAIGDPMRGPVRAFLRWRPIAYTGLVSYGVYLWHQGWTDKAMEWTGSVPFRANFVVVTGLAVALSMLAATLSWYGLERPVNRRRTVPLRRWLRPLGSP